MVEANGQSLLEQRPRQPKREVCEYLAAHGFNVPHIFNNLEEARNNGVPFIIRSEHPQDLDGISGVRDSIIVDGNEAVQRFLSEEMIRMRCDEYHTTVVPQSLIRKQAKILRQQFIETLMLGLGELHRHDYSNMRSVDPWRFDQETSYSYWEYIPGVNRQIIADSAVEDRYHMLSHGPKSRSYAVVEGGLPRFLSGRNAEEDLTADCVQRLIETYEAVRSLLGSDNCLLLEIQSVQETARDYLLQVLYTRSFHPATFSISSEPPDAVTADFVRGKTEKDGALCHLRVFTRGTVPRKTVNVDAAFDFHGREVLTGALLPQRKVHCMSSSGGLDLHFAKASVRHFNAMQLFFPEATFVVPHSRILNKDELAKMSQDLDLALPVRFVIDGTRGYMERLGDLTKCPIDGYEPDDPSMLEFMRRYYQESQFAEQSPTPKQRQLLLFDKKNNAAASVIDEASHESTSAILPSGITP